jgi:hypothetical protein
MPVHVIAPLKTMAKTASVAVASIDTVAEGNHMVVVYNHMVAFCNCVVVE